jgi:hypothetical protein
MIKFILGLILGIAATLFATHFRQKDYTYVQLKHDYHIVGIGEVKKGTILRFDEAMSEGFTRYVLYLNLKDDDVTIHKTDHKYTVIPYWLSNVDNK